MLVNSRDGKSFSSPQTKDLLGDIVESQLTDDGFYKLSGMTSGSEWSEWLIKAKKVCTEMVYRRHILVDQKINILL
jgi:hypothetical protein